MRRFASSSIESPTARRSAWDATRRRGWRSGWPISRRAIWSTFSFPATVRRPSKSRSRWRFSIGGSARIRSREKTKFIALGEAYHGDTLGSASVSGIARFHALFKPLLFDVIRAPLPDPRRLPAGTSRERRRRNYFLRRLEALLRRITTRLAALVIEPLVQCAAGMVMHPPGFLRGLRELTQTYGVLLIADEVAVGFGRTGTMFACEQEDVVPDFLCLGKGLSGGYLPMAATLTNDEIYRRSSENGPKAGRCTTATRSAAIRSRPRRRSRRSTCLTKSKRWRTCLRRLHRLGEHLCRLAEHPHVAESTARSLRGHGTDARQIIRRTLSSRRAACLARLPRDACRGVWLRPLGDVLYVMPPLAISIEELDEVMDTLTATIESVDGLIDRLNRQSR